MDRVSVRLARTEDLEALCSAVADARVTLYRLAADQWQDIYPHSGVLRADIAAGRLYAVADAADTAVGMMAITFDGEPAYHAIDGAWRTVPPYGTIHRLAVAAPHRRTGAASVLIAHAETLCRAAGICALRIDTHTGNTPMRAFLQKQGFQYCGTVQYPAVGERLGYDKALP